MTTNLKLTSMVLAGALVAVSVFESRAHASSVDASFYRDPEGTRVCYFYNATNDDIKRISEIQEPIRLSLRSPKFDKEAISYIANGKVTFKSFTICEFNESCINFEFSELMSAISSKTENLHIFSAIIQDSDLNTLNLFSKLRDLTISNVSTEDTEDGAWLGDVTDQNLTCLRTLSIENTTFSDTSLKCLSKLESLGSANLSGNRITQEGYANFQINNPNIEISYSARSVSNETLVIGIPGNKLISHIEEIKYLKSFYIFRPDKYALEIIGDYILDQDTGFSMKIITVQGKEDIILHFKIAGTS